MARRSYLTLQHKLLPSFDAQQDTFLVFNLRLLHRHDLLHRQQVLLGMKLTRQKRAKVKQTEQRADNETSRLG